jgi:hypothetical protein
MCLGIPGQILVELGEAQAALAAMDSEDANFIKGLVNLGMAASTGGAGAGAIAALLGNGKSEAPTYKARTVAAPDPRVTIRWGGMTWATPRQRNTFNPKWDFTFLVPAEIAEHKSLRVDVLDADDGDDENIGTDAISGKDVVKDDVFRKGFGGAEELVLEVEKVGEERAPVERKIRIDTTRGWMDTGVDVVAGQTVQISVSGTHCLPGGRCIGPEGEAAIAFQQEVNGEEAAPPVRVGELGGFIGGYMFPVGRGSQLVANSTADCVWESHRARPLVRCRRPFASSTR